MENQQALVLDTLKMNVLVDMVNALGGTATMKTFSQRSKAIERLNKLAAEQEILLEDRFDVDGRPFTKLELAELEAAEKKAVDEAEAAYLKAQAIADAEEEARIKAEAATAKAPKGPHIDHGDIDWDNVPVTCDVPKATEDLKALKAPKAKKAPAEPKPKRVSIRSVAEVLILEVTGLDENQRKVGHAYETILAKIKEQYPDAKTSIACLRWYAVHMRERGVLPPSRPRANPVKAQATAAEPKAEV